MGDQRETMADFVKDNSTNDEEFAQRVIGLNSKEQFMKKSAGDAPKELIQPSKADKPKKRKKKKAPAAGAMSFDMGEEGEDEVPEMPKKKMCNPNANAGFLKKKEWMSESEKLEIQKKELDKDNDRRKRYAELSARPLTITYCFTMRPQGPATAKTSHAEGEEESMHEKPPRRFMNRSVTSTWGDTTAGFLQKARKELSEFRTATEKSKHGEQAAMASQNLMLVDGTMICPDGKTFLEMSESKFCDDGEPIFHFGNESAAENVKSGDSLFNICERHWYDGARFHFPQSQWEGYDSKMQYRNPKKTMSKKASGSNEFTTAYMKAKGVEMGDCYAKVQRVS